MDVGQAESPVVDPVDDVMIGLDELEKGIGVPVGSRWEESIPILAYVFAQTLLAYGVQAFRIVEARAEYADRHSFGHGLREVRHVEVEDVDLGPCVPVEVQLFSAVVVGEAVRQLEINQVCTVDHGLYSKEELGDGPG